MYYDVCFTLSVLCFIFNKNKFTIQKLFRAQTSNVENSYKYKNNEKSYKLKITYFCLNTMVYLNFTKTKLVFKLRTSQKSFYKIN